MTSSVSYRLHDAAAPIWEACLKHPFYGEWIQGYASEEYSATNQALIELMDELAADATEEQLAYLTDVFVNCSRYELGFWDMAWEVRI